MVDFATAERSGRLFSSPSTVIVLVGAYGIPLLSLALLFVNGASLHDRIAGTRVATEDRELEDENQREDGHTEAGGPS